MYQLMAEPMYWLIAALSLLSIAAGAVVVCRHWLLPAVRSVLECLKSLPETDTATPADKSRAMAEAMADAIKDERL